jgi:hypothetical protein
MKAIVRTEYGPPKVLQLGEVKKARPRANEAKESPHHVEHGYEQVRRQSPDLLLLVSPRLALGC